MVTPAAINDLLAEQWPDARARCVEVSERHAVAELACVESDLRPGGFVSGPTLFGVADAALWFLCFGAAGRIEPLALTSDLAIRFLRPAKGEKVFARAELAKATGRSVVGSVAVWTDGPEAPVAIAQGSYVRPPRAARDG
ncbi:MAG: PaaI family thioesterase [Thermoplasmatota archaeon]